MQCNAMQPVPFKRRHDYLKKQNKTETHTYGLLAACIIGIIVCDPQATN
jgi:hypothetical protein